ncbi:hypothetical protein BLNAU_17252 [Blattamonas nauphoetae]|uniref:Uncharacterized protein n=1 Tax=Blattamonas nauphoetae TaxID=2049346 RepID=A0ABQ9XB15_9EUKA|nr:hypothetical protein BLNAU_17252 [Blattamonas nauphoetae]
MGHSSSSLRKTMAKSNPALAEQRQSRNAQVQQFVLPPLLFTNPAHFIVHSSIITRSSVAITLMEYSDISSLLLQSPISKGITTVTITILSLPTVGSRVGGIRFALIDSSAPIPKLGEFIGYDVKGILSHSVHRLVFSAATLHPRDTDLEMSRIAHILRKEIVCGWRWTWTPNLERWTSIVHRVIPTSTSCTAFSNNLGFSLEGLAHSFTPNWPNSNDDAMSARFLGSWIKQHVFPSTEQDFEPDIEKESFELSLPSTSSHLSTLSNASCFLVGDTEQCSESKY